MPTTSSSSSPTSTSTFATSPPHHTRSKYRAVRRSRFGSPHTFPADAAPHPTPGPSSIALALAWTGDVTGMAPPQDTSFSYQTLDDAATAALTDATLTKWEKTLLGLTDCTVCLTRIARGESILLKACNHAVCAKCAAHQRQASAPVVCGICHLASPALDGRHPLVEAELAADGLEHAACTKCLESPDEDDRLPATAACSDCHWLLCESHATHHRLAPKFKAHTLTPLPDSAAAARCPAHDQPYTAYCTADACRALACTLCLASTHPLNSAAHSVRVLDDALASELRGRLERAVETARLATEACVRHAVAAQGACDASERRDATLRTEVAATFRLLRAMLDQREQEVLSELETLGTAERAALTQAHDKDAHTWCVLTSTADVAVRLLESSTTAVLAQLTPAAEERLRSLVDGPPTDGRQAEVAPPASTPPPGRSWTSYWSPAAPALKPATPAPVPAPAHPPSPVPGVVPVPAAFRFTAAPAKGAFAFPTGPSPAPAVVTPAPGPASASVATPTAGPSVGPAAAAAVPPLIAALDRSAPQPAPLRFDVDADAKVLEAAIARLGRFTMTSTK